MGMVYLAHDPRLSRDVALKSVAGLEPGSATARERLLREARAAAGLTHPNIAGVYDVVEADGNAYIVMEYVEGESLAARLRRGPMLAAEAAAIGAQLANALAAAHARGIVHRDLKPGNIQITPGGVVKVLDFGIARSTRAADTTSADTMADAGLTSPGMLVGTPAYMSPEQVEGKTVGPASDIFSLGIVIFEMLTGQRPFTGHDSISLAIAIVGAPPPDVRALVPTAPPGLLDIVSSALEKNPARRPAATALHASLVAIGHDLAGGSDPARSGAKPASMGREESTRQAPRARRPWLMIATAGALVATIGGWSATHYFRRPAAASPPAVVAILPPTDVEGEASLEAVAAGVSSVLAGNLGLLPGITLVARSATAPYIGARRQDSRRSAVTSARPSSSTSRCGGLRQECASPRTWCAPARVRRPGRRATSATR